MMRWIAALAGSCAGLVAAGASAAPTETILHAFAALPRFGQSGPHDAGQPFGALTLDAAGNLFGTAVSGGAACGENGPGCGAVFEFKPKGAKAGKYTEHIVSRFNEKKGGGGPDVGLTMGPGGVLFGTTDNGGFGPPGAGYGTLFQLTPPATGTAPWTRTTLYRFKGGADGANPHGRLLLGAGGVLYGTTENGGAGADGTVFELVPPAPGKTAWRKETLYTFTGADGARPQGGLLAIASGQLVGVTNIGGNQNYGVVFALAAPVGGKTSWAETTLYSFDNTTIGAFPGPIDLIEDATGVLYGTTSYGGATGQGAAFALEPPSQGQSAWTPVLLYNFAGGTDGAMPMSGVVMDAQGSLYGTTEAGGSAGLGTVYRIEPPAEGGTAWQETVLHAFAGGTDGSTPIGGVVVDARGAVFGTTSIGGSGCPQWADTGCGTLFEITP